MFAFSKTLHSPLSCQERYVTAITRVPFVAWKYRQCTVLNETHARLTIIVWEQNMPQRVQTFLEVHAWPDFQCFCWHSMSPAVRVNCCDHHLLPSWWAKSRYQVFMKRVCHELLPAVHPCYAKASGAVLVWPLSPLNAYIDEKACNIDWKKITQLVWCTAEPVITNKYALKLAWYIT